MADATVPPTDDHVPAWVADAVFYQIFPDRFAFSDRFRKPSNLEPWDSPPTVHGYKGGDLYGIVEKLDHLVDLGINAIYLNPIFTSASNHRERALRSDAQYHAPSVTRPVSRAQCQNSAPILPP